MSKPCKNLMRSFSLCRLLSPLAIDSDVGIVFSLHCLCYGWVAWHKSGFDFMGIAVHGTVVVIGFNVAYPVGCPDLHPSSASSIDF